MTGAEPRAYSVSGRSAAGGLSSTSPPAHLQVADWAELSPTRVAGGLSQGSDDLRTLRARVALGEHVGDTISRRLADLQEAAGEAQAAVADLRTGQRASHRQLSERLAALEDRLAAAERTPVAAARQPLGESERPNRLEQRLAAVETVLGLSNSADWDAGGGDAGGGGAMAVLQAELRAVVGAVAELRSKLDGLSSAREPPAAEVVATAVAKEVAEMEQRLRAAAAPAASREGSPAASGAVAELEERIAAAASRRAQEHRRLQQSLAAAAAAPSSGSPVGDALSGGPSLVQTVSMLELRATAAERALGALSAQQHQQQCEVAAELVVLAQKQLAAASAAQQGAVAGAARSESHAAAARAAESCLARLSRWESQQAAAAAEQRALCDAATGLQHSVAQCREELRAVEAHVMGSSAAADITQLREAVNTLSTQMRSDRRDAATQRARLESLDARLRAQIEAASPPRRVADALNAEHREGLAELRRELAAAIGALRSGAEQAEGRRALELRELERRQEAALQQQVKRLADLALRADSEAADAARAELSMTVEPLRVLAERVTAQLSACAEGLSAANAAIGALADRVDALDSAVGRSRAQQGPMRAGLSPEAQRARGVAVAALFGGAK
eukprot:TRINITY_DN4389_c0_g1_i1.p1 TRINITY_DN4389_c0_g1~~TRINITY_DN4389_c0_g1_i1.p1  ORF type:complete len:646 (+),score=231.52 TRINITY_DN4389_c0_g1_i1:68-1939(+)